MKTIKTQRKVPVVLPEILSVLSPFYTCSFKVPLIEAVVRECKVFFQPPFCLIKLYSNRKKQQQKEKKRKSEKRYPVTPSQGQHLLSSSEPVTAQCRTVRRGVTSYPRNKILTIDKNVLQIYPNFLIFQIRRTRIQENITIHVLFPQVDQSTLKAGTGNLSILHSN